ncbi:MAG TPA: hypothetical protein VG897_11670 [Terriglobales bacterium]|nr:hypothetical protein [Terriglobales bacterium]
MPSRIVLLLTALCLCLPVVAQELTTREAQQAKEATDAQTGKTKSPLDVLVEKQFGPDFSVDLRFQPMVADFDADGHEDLGLIGFSKNPLGGSAKFKYTVLDPYDSYFGIGDPKITTHFGGFGDGTSHCILFIHDWKGEAPKSKWVIVNVPFEKIAAGQVTTRKKTVPAVATIEMGGLSSLVYFDGKKYKWEPNEFDDISGSRN